MAAIKGALTEAGLLAFVVENRIHVVPPCTITAEQVAQGLAILMRSLLALPVWRSRGGAFAGPDTVARRRGLSQLNISGLTGSGRAEPVNGSCRPGKAQPPPGEINHDTVPDILPGGAGLHGPTGCEPVEWIL